MFEIFNSLVTVAVALAAVYVAHMANRAASASNKIAQLSNEISIRSVQVEADKLVIEWGQRCLACFSAASSLRLAQKDHLSESEFEAARRKLMAELVALRDEGDLFFQKHHDPAKPDVECIIALEKVREQLKRANFHPPHTTDKAEIEAQNLKLRAHVHTFIGSIQRHVGSEWVQKPDESSAFRVAIAPDKAADQPKID